VSRSIARHLTYLHHAMKGNPWLDFISMGLGIQRRAERFKKSWEPHLDATRSFIEQNTRTGGSGIALLGAGRLYDVPLKALMERFDHVCLVDIDSSLAATWAEARKIWGPRLITEFRDVTGVLQEWQGRLHACNSSRELLWFLHENPPRVTFSYSTVVSLNILSQLGVMWRDRVFACCRSKGFDISPEIEHIIAVSSARLELAHLESLANDASEIVLVADRSFVTIGRRGEVVEQEDALYGPWPDTISGFTTSGQASWRWEIVPVGGEVAHQGTVHEVQARCFRRT
jgi:hypothetical protein